MNTTLQVIKNIFHKIGDWIVMLWWLFPILFFASCYAYAYTLIECPFTWKEDLAGNIFFAMMILDIIKYVLLILRKQSKRYGISLLIGGPISFVGCVGVGFASMNAPDGYARELSIPKGLKYNVPLSQEYEMQKDSSWVNIPAEAKIDVKDRNSYLQIWDGCQGGIYVYDFYYPSLPKGTVYLKCFEVTKNDPLSAGRVKGASSVAHEATKSFSKIVDKQEFTIFEGDWREYYAVRVEVWHCDASTKKETKLLEKIYRMEGWMR